MLHENPVKYQEAIENNESYITRADLMPPAGVRFARGDGEWEAWTNIDINAEALEFFVWSLTVTKFGDFNIEFD
jgi:hypothetical protein